MENPRPNCPNIRVIAGKIEINNFVVAEVISAANEMFVADFIHSLSDAAELEDCHERSRDEGYESGFYEGTQQQDQKISDALDELEKNGEITSTLRDLLDESLK